MVDEILPNLYRIHIPLPNNPLGWVNSYVIKSRERNLIIDTGLNRRECSEAMRAGLVEIELDLKKTDFYITHSHADHFALAPILAEATSEIYLNRPDKELMERWTGFEEITGFVMLNGFPESELQEAVDTHPGNRYGTSLVPKMNPVEDGDTIECGDYHFTAVATPGHTIGHTCLYEPAKRLLVAGDHILYDITPNITCWWEKQNPLKHYIASLDKIYGLQVDLVLPGHRRLIEDCQGRIKELKQHHQRRNEEILSILKHGPKTAYDLASMMTWDIDSESWEGFPASQKWFATGETIAHLRYLEEEGRVFTENKAGRILFSNGRG